MLARAEVAARFSALGRRTHRPPDHELGRQLQDPGRGALQQQAGGRRALAEERSQESCRARRACRGGGIESGLREPDDLGGCLRG